MNIYWDRQNQIFVSSPTNSAQISSLELKLRDQVAVNVYDLTIDPATGSYTVGTIPAGYSIKFGLRLTRVSPDPVLAYCSVWNYDTSKYVGVISLADPNLVVAMGSEDYNDFIGEFVLQDMSGNHRDSTQLNIRIYFDVLHGTETELLSVLPFPWMEEFVDPGTGKKCLRFKNSDGETVGPILTPTGV